MSFEVRLADIRCQYGTQILFEKINVTIPAGGAKIITGKSGSGKSTLLETIAGVLPAQSGSVIWDDHDLATAPRVVVAGLELRSAVVFQQHALISYLPLFENIALPLRHHRRGTKAEIDEKVSSLIGRLQLHRVAWNLPESLSEGQRRLGSIARALAISPEMICMDEPTYGLDDEQRKLFQPLFEELVADESMTVVIATDDPKIFSREGLSILNLNPKVEL